MRIILLSGGSGKRLWPLSNEIRSKIFLKLLPSEEGGRESMIQRVCRQLKQSELLGSVSIVTHESQVEITQLHIGHELPILAEPHKRGTYMAVALAVSYLHSKQQVDRDETIVVMPVDLFVETEFYSLLHLFPEILAQSGSNLALIGTTPTRPSTQYGYIVPQEVKGSEEKRYCNVSQFVEKPDESKAARLIQDKALWNCGIFAFPLSYMLDSLISKGLPTGYEQLVSCYPQLPEMSFDQEVVEKALQCVVIPYEKEWKDLGDWRILPEHLGSSIIGQGRVSSDSLYTHLINELSLPIHIIGVPNVVVVASMDGILVAHKDKANEIKQMISGEQPPRYGEKRWGTYQILEHLLSDGESLVKRVTMQPGKHTSYHYHQNRREMCTILSGSGEITIEGRKHSIQKGDVLQIPIGAKHRIKAVTELNYIGIQWGSDLLEDDSISVPFSENESI